MKALLNSNWHECVLHARPVSDPNGPTLEEAFADAYVNFSHFARAGDFEIISVEHLWKALLRCMAFQCADNQMSTDLIGPIHWGLDNPVDAKNTSPLYGQVKNTAKAEHDLLNPHQAGESPKNRYTLSLLHHVGLSRAAVFPYPSIPAKDLRQIGDRQRTENIHKRHYQIVIEGCSPETYNIIPSSAEAIQYRGILCHNKVVEDFPREGPHYSALLYQKPVFYADRKESLDWAD